MQVLVGELLPIVLHRVHVTLKPATSTCSMSPNYEIIQVYDAYKAAALVHVSRYDDANEFTLRESVAAP